MVIENNCWVSIDKPLGYSSAKVVAIIKKFSKAKKVGHAGTLDPLATGVLPIAINKATKTCQWVSSVDKEYYFEITWGEFRDTDDSEGKITSVSKKNPNNCDIINNMVSFIGKIKQMPPQFSAIKVDGKKSYDLARNGEFIDLKPREVEIYDIKLIFNDKNRSGFKISCSKGTYIRSFCRELADKLGICGYISKLTRLRVGNFLLKDTISLEKLKIMINYDDCDDLLLQLRDVLNFMPEIEIDDFEALKVKNGQIIQLNQNLLHQDTVKIINNGNLIGIGKCFDRNLKPINILI